MSQHGHLGRPWEGGRPQGMLEGWRRWCRAVAASKEGAGSGWALSCEGGRQVQLSSLQPSTQQSSSGAGFAYSRHLNFCTYYYCCVCVCAPWGVRGVRGQLAGVSPLLLSLMSSACVLDILVTESHTAVPCVWFSLNTVSAASLYPVECA